MVAHLRKIVVSLPFRIAAIGFGAYLIFGFFLVNPLAKKLLPWIGEKMLASQLSVRRVEFNPLTLEATVEGLKLAEKTGQPLAGFDRLYVNLETASLFRFAWRIKKIEMDGPHADFIVRQGGKLNWGDLIAKLDEDKAPPSKTIPRILIDRIKIARGDIEFTDANRSGAPFRLSLIPLDIELDGLSTLREDRGQYKLAARLPEQGGTLMWDGDVSLNPLKSNGKIGLQGVGLPKLLRAIKTPHNFDLPSGTLAAAFNYRFALGKERPLLWVNGANVIVQNLSLAQKDKPAPVFELKEARIDNANIDLTAQIATVSAISLVGGKVSAMREVNGTLDWQTLFAAPQAVTPTPTLKAAPWKLAVRAIKLADWSGRYSDQGFAKPLRVDADRVGLTAALEGTIGATIDLRVAPVDLAVGPVQVFSGDGKTPVALLKEGRLSNAVFDMAANRVGIDAIELSGANTVLEMGKDKRFNWNDILAKVPRAVVAPQPTVSENARPATDLHLKRFALNGMQFSFNDRSLPKSASLDIIDGHIALQGLTLDLDKPVSLAAGFSVKQGGNFSAEGQVTPGKGSGSLQLKLADFSLKQLAPYVNRFARLKLNDGAASTSGRLSFAKGKSGPSLDYIGGFAVSHLAIDEEDTGDKFLGWEKLASDSLEFKLGPNSLHITELVAVKPFAKVIIFEDKSLNIQRIQRGYKPVGSAAATEQNVGDDETPQSESAKVVPQVKAADKPADFPLKIERIRVVHADAEFADLSLPTKFGARMHGLGGVITSVATNPATVAQVELDGQVDEYGSARIRGSIQPFRASEFTDLLLQFRNLEMSSLTPYSGKFAGRRIDSGRLSVDLEYKIKQRQLAGQNKFVIDKLKLGAQVDSKDAVNLPLDLAIALLQDSDGVIDLDLPVTGSLDDPKFSYGKIIWKAVVNVLTKLVTAPFRALGSLLGISSDHLASIDFDFGSAELLPPEREKLKNIAQALVKRPALSLTVEPGYAMRGDRRALQELAIRRHVAALMGLRADPGQEPGPVDTSIPKAQEALESLYGQRFAKQGGLRALRAEYEKPRADMRTIHIEMLERLTLQIPVTDDELKLLAQRRGQAIQQELVMANRLDLAKVSVSAPIARNDDAKMALSGMSLGVRKSPATTPATAQ